MATLFMTPNTKLSKEERQIAILKARQANEKIFKLIAKIIRWQTESLEDLVSKTIDKVTRQEWQKYTQHILNISTSEKERARNKLKETYQVIKAHGGFK